jgi:hypothetical protein
MNGRPRRHHLSFRACVRKYFSTDTAAEPALPPETGRWPTAARSVGKRVGFEGRQHGVSPQVVKAPCKLVALWHGATSSSLACAAKSDAGSSNTACGELLCRGRSMNLGRIACDKTSGWGWGWGWERSGRARVLAPPRFKTGALTGYAAQLSCSRAPTRDRPCRIRASSPRRGWSTSCARWQGRWASLRS